MGLGAEATHFVERDRVVRVARRLDEREQSFQAEPERRSAAHEDALVGERGAGRPPTVVLGPDETVVGHEHVVEEDLVEHGVAGQLAQRPDLDARRSACRS